MSKDKNIEMKQAYIGNKSHMKCKFGEFIQPLTVTNNKNVTIQGLEIATEKDNVISKNIPYKAGKGAFGICKNGGCCQFKAMEKVKWENVNENVYVGDAKTLNGKSFFRCPYVAGQNIEIIEHNQQAIGAFSEKNKSNFLDDALQMEQQVIMMLVKQIIGGKDPIEELRNLFMDQLIKEMGYATEVGAYTVGNDFKDLADSISKVIQNPSLETFSDLYFVNNDILRDIGVPGANFFLSADDLKSLKRLSKNGKKYDVSINGITSLVNDNIDSVLDEKLKPVLGRKISPEADKWARSTYKQMVLGNGTEEMTLMGTIGEFINGVIPISGQLADARDVIFSVNKGDGLGVVLSGIGLFPGLDTLKRGPKIIKKIAKNADEAIMAINKAIGTNITPKILDSIDEIAVATKKGAKAFTEAMGNWKARNTKALSQLVSNSMIVSKMGKLKYFLEYLFCYISKHGCLTAGTKVKVENGYKNIEDIKEGDFVYSFDEETEKIELREVKNIIKNTVEELIIVETETQTINVTLEHPFYIKEKGWVDAQNLEKDDVLITIDGETKIKNVSLEHYFIKEVYNLEIERNHTFYITEDDILTHNDGLCAEEIARIMEMFKKLGITASEYNSEEARKFIIKAFDRMDKEGRLKRGVELEWFKAIFGSFLKSDLIHVGKYENGYFKYIDFLNVKNPENPIGISYKTLDIRLPSYQSKEGLVDTIKKYAKDLASEDFISSGKQEMLNDNNFFKEYNYLDKGIIEKLPENLRKNQRELIIEIPIGTKNRIPNIQDELDDILNTTGIKNIKIQEVKY